MRGLHRTSERQVSERKARQPGWGAAGGLDGKRNMHEVYKASIKGGRLVGNTRLTNERRLKQGGLDRGTGGMKGSRVS